MALEPKTHRVVTTQWRHGHLYIGAVEVAHVGQHRALDGRMEWYGQVARSDANVMATEAEARAWVEAQLYGEAPRG